VYPKAWQAGKAPVGCPLRQRPGAPAQHRPGVVGHLRGGFFALLIWRTACTGSPPCLGREDAVRVQDALCKRLGKFGLTLEPTKTKLVEFGRFAQRHAAKHGRKRPETIYFLGFTLYCTRNLKGNFRIGMRTEKSRSHVVAG